MQVVLALHIIFLIAWFAGLFYLPRLFVYHAAATDQIGIERFKVMEYKLYFFIMMPAAILTTIFGFWRMEYQWTYFITQGWMQAKLALVALLWVYHLYCGYLVGCFKLNKNPYSSRFYRFFNEVPTLLLIVIVFLVVLQ